jgi:hypothetical protein
MLIAHGHRLADIWGYSMRAVQVYADLIVARQQSELHALTVAIRHSQGTDQKIFKQFLESLQGDD